MATVTQTLGVAALVTILLAMPAAAANPCRLQQFGELCVADDHGFRAAPVVVNAIPSDCSWI